LSVYCLPFLMGIVPQIIGSECEYILWRMLSEKGYFCMRVRGSGRGYSATIYPDLLAIKKGRVLMFEVKYRTDKQSVTISERRFKGYKMIAERAGAEFYIAAYYVPIGEFRFLRLDEYDNISKGWVYYRFLSFLHRGRRIDDIA